MRILANTNYDFLRWRWHALVLSLAIIGAGVATMAMQGLRLGIDFTGGTQIVVRFAQPTTEDAVRNALAGLPGEPSVQTYGPPGSNEILIRLQQVVAREQGTNIEEAGRIALERLRAANIGDFEPQSTDAVGPVIGEELRQRGIYATLTALGGILVYIGLRFRFSFAVGAVVAVFHDILITFSLLHWFGYDLTLNVIAAILTITGYSVNDTIVVFDRVRENQRLMRRASVAEMINRAVNQTLSRTVITAGTTFLAVLALFIFGGEVLRGMSFTLLVGIVTGTYSTIFIASAVAIFFTRSRGTTAGGAQAPPQARARRARA
jgi:preprotein translocase subunit SecF